MKEINFKKQFELLNNKNLIYFDNSASTLKPNVVVRAVNNYNTKTPVNVGRGVYKLAYDTTNQVENVRGIVTIFISAKPNESEFTQNTIYAINLVAQSFGASLLKSGDEIIIGKLEHHSNYLPWLEIAKKTGAKLVYVPLDENNNITVKNFKKVLTKNTKIVALSLVSNVLGSITPISEIANLAHKNNAYVVVDAAQAVSHFEINVAKLNCDFLAFSGYKMFAPSGVGVLFGKEILLNKMQPITFGGGMVLDANADTLQYKEAPHKFEVGTLPISSIIGLGEAVKFINTIGYDYITKQDQLLKNYILQKLSEFKQVEIYNKAPHVSIISFNILGIHAHDVATMYDKLGVCVRAGNHCAQPLTEQLNQVATLRVSLAFYNTVGEIDKFIIATQKVIEFFNKF